MQEMKHASKEFTLAFKRRIQYRDISGPTKKAGVLQKEKKTHFFSFLTIFEGHYFPFNISPVIPLFWTSGDICLGYQTQGGSLACVLCCLLIIDSSYSPLVRHLQTSVAHLPIQALMEVGLMPHCAADRAFNRMKFCASVSMAIHHKDTWSDHACLLTDER